jgi:hypothetical protein
MNDPNLNPYAAPAVLADAPPDTSFFKDGAFLVTRDKAELPKRCLRTNEEVPDSGWRKSVQMAYTPRWIFFLLPLGIIPFAIAIGLTQKRMKLVHSRSPATLKTRPKWRLLVFVFLALFIGCFYAIYYMFQHRVPNVKPDVNLIIGLVAGGLLSIIPMSIAGQMAQLYRAKKHFNGWFWIKGCSPEFLQTLPEFPSDLGRK